MFLGSAPRWLCAGRQAISLHPPFQSPALSYVEALSRSHGLLPFSHAKQSAYLCLTRRWEVNHIDARGLKVKCQTGSVG